MFRLNKFTLSFFESSRLLYCGWLRWTMSGVASFDEPRYVILEDLKLSSVGRPCCLDSSSKSFSSSSLSYANFEE